MDRDDLRALGIELHERMLSGDVTALARLAEAFLGPLITSLQRLHLDLPDPHMVDTAVEDVLLNYADHPDRYDPTKLDLFGYLRMSARSDLLNLRRHFGPEFVSVESAVELEDTPGEHIVETATDGVLDDEVIAALSPMWDRLAVLLPEFTDRQIVWLLMEGERNTDEYAAVLGILELPREERAREVKRHKDRVKVTLRRRIGELRLDE